MLPVSYRPVKLVIAIALRHGGGLSRSFLVVLMQLIHIRELTVCRIYTDEPVRQEMFPVHVD